MTMAERIQETGAPGKITALLASVAQAIVGDYFVWALAVLAISNFFDWIAGRWAARAQGRFSKTESRKGLFRKVIAVMVVLLVRLIELVLDQAGVISTGGLFAVGACALLVYEDLESLERHRMALGAGPIPGLSSLLAKLRELTTGDRRTEVREEAAEP
jgi:phage-related holin